MADESYKLRMVQKAVDGLRSLHDGASAIRGVLCFRQAAIPALRNLLFEREQSGLFDTRCRAVEALAALNAFDVLGEFLSRTRADVDAVESLGDDVVVSVAAQAIAKHKQEWVYALLYRLAGLKPLRGVLAGLGMFLREESIPVFIRALEEDEVRATAETVLRRFGIAARPALLAACAPCSEPMDESESCRRKRRASLVLLVEIGIPENGWPAIRDLMRDRDARIAALAAAAFRKGDRSGLISRG